MTDFIRKIKSTYTELEKIEAEVRKKLKETEKIIDVLEDLITKEYPVDYEGYKNKIRVFLRKKVMQCENFAELVKLLKDLDVEKAEENVCKFVGECEHIDHLAINLDFQKIILHITHFGRRKVIEIEKLVEEFVL
ncbi:MAG: hypothetical protein N3A69_05710 [Leptospiraceae bacterium]|nr:hypothetical protein [Leptospiraceae bacterium]